MTTDAVGATTLQLINLGLMPSMNYNKDFTDANTASLKALLLRQKSLQNPFRCSRKMHVDFSILCGKQLMETNCPSIVMPSQQKYAIRA